MTQFRTSLANLVLPVALLAGPASASAPQAPGVMIVAVSRDQSTLKGGISSEDLHQPGKVDIEILAYLTSEGEWKSHPCANSYSEPCSRFAKEYLASPHRYTVVSADGRGATVDAKPTMLGECFDYATTGDYSGASIRKTAIAADVHELFAGGASATRLSRAQAHPILEDLQTLVPTKLDSTRELRL